MHVLNLQRKRKWLSFVHYVWSSHDPQRPVILSAMPSLPRTSIICRVFPLLNGLDFNTCEGLTQATPALRRNPVSLRLRITKQDNHSIHLFMGYCSATLPSENGPFQWGTFFSLARSFPLLLMGFLGSGWGGFWGCKRTPLYFVCYGSFLALIKDMKRSQDFKAVDGLSVTVTSPNSTKEVRSEVRLWGQMVIYMLVVRYKTQNRGVIISITQNIWIIPYSSEKSLFWPQKKYFMHILYLQKLLQIS